MFSARQVDSLPSVSAREVAEYDWTRARGHLAGRSSCLPVVGVDFARLTVRVRQSIGLPRRCDRISIKPCVRACVCARVQLRRHSVYEREGNLVSARSWFSNRSAAAISQRCYPPRVLAAYLAVPTDWREGTNITLFTFRPRIKAWLQGRRARHLGCGNV